MSPTKEIRVRFAPSPTGRLHAGNMRTAVFNWLFAAKMGGKFVLRIEDTDVERSAEEYSQEIIDSLRWLGIGWDEGPYYQSQRTEIYSGMVAPLLAKGNLYPCFCTDEQLEQDRKAAEKRGRPPIYAGRCAKLDETERKERAAKEPHSLRFRITGDTLAYTDAIRGETTVNLRLLGDFIAVRSDGTATYNFAASIDDALMKISHVIRGEDHMSNTPKQILLMAAMGYSPPMYAHLPIILAEDGTKLSKRHSHSSFHDLIEGGYLPESVLVFMVLMGWHPKDNKDDMTVEEMINSFSLEDVTLRASHYNLQKLDWLNKHKILHTEPERLLAYGKRFIKNNAAAFENLSLEKKLSLLSAARENISRLDGLDAETEPFLSFSVEARVKQELSAYPATEVVAAFLPMATHEDFKEAANAVSRQTGAKGKALYMPIRAALSGRLHGPELKKLYDFLSPEERESRLKQFMEYLGK